MPDSFLYYANYILCFAFVAAGTLALVLRRRTGDDAYLFAAVYFLCLLVIELDIYGHEAGSPLGLLMQRVFGNFSLPNTFGYVCSDAMLVLLLCRCLSKKPGFAPAAGILCLLVWFILVLFLPQSPFTVWLYILPNQLFLLALAIYGLLATGADGVRPQGRSVRFLLWSLAIFSVLILAEDSAVLYLSLRGASFSIRNTAEDLMHLLFAVYGAVLLFREASAPLPAPAAAPAEKRAEAAAPSAPLRRDLTGEYARRIGLTSREAEVFEVMLYCGRYQDVCDRLGISLGTAKTHAHNIYMKADAENRAELLERYRLFASEALKEPGAGASPS